MIIHDCFLAKSVHLSRLFIRNHSFYKHEIVIVFSKFTFCEGLRRSILHFYYGVFCTISFQNHDSNSYLISKMNL
jgi:hypothetical protein